MLNTASPGINTKKTDPRDVRVFNGEVFSHAEHANLAFAIWRRWGRSLPDAASAWRRLFQNSCTEEQFAALVSEADSFVGFF